MLACGRYIQDEAALGQFFVQHQGRKNHILLKHMVWVCMSEAVLLYICIGSRYTVFSHASSFSKLIRSDAAALAKATFRMVTLMAMASPCC